MEAKPTKVPLGGAAQLFLAGLLLEAVVMAVAFRATVVDFIEAQGVDLPAAATGAAEPAPASVAAPTPTDEPAAATGAGEPAATPGSGTIQAIQAGIRERADELRAVCFDTLGRPDDAGAGFKLDLTIEPDGRVDRASVSGPNPALRACIQAEASTWTFGGPGKRIRVSKTIAFQ